MPYNSLKDRETLIKALANLIESNDAADGDFGGEQREWHLPRLAKATGHLCLLFPGEFYEALKVAKTPYGTPVCPEDEPAAKK